MNERCGVRRCRHGLVTCVGCHNVRAAEVGGCGLPHRVNLRGAFCRSPLEEWSTCL